LARTGATITGSASADGVSWRTVGSVASPLGSSGLAGLAVTSQNTAVLNTSTFDNVSVGSAPSASLPAPWVDQDVGATGLAGSASYANGTYMVRGAGADIWGSADAFHFVEQPISGDMQIVARVASVENTNKYA